MSDLWAIEATFQPTIADTLRPESLTRVGKRLRFTRGWEITEEDGGPYVGQVAWIPDRDDLGWFGWVPTADLADVVPLETND